MSELVLYPQSEQPMRIDVYIAEQSLGISRSGVKGMIESGDMLCNGLQVKKAGSLVSLGDIITLKDFSKEPIQVLPQDLPIEILYQDADIAIVNKAQGMVVHPAFGNYQNTLVNALLFYIKELSDINGYLRPGIVHRLDKDTSGLLVVAKNNISHISLASQFKTHSVERHYLALLQGKIKEDSGTITTNLGRNPKDRKKIAVAESGKPASTSWQVQERFAGYSLAEFRLHTGRTHQIRVHAQYLGHPVVGDATYGGRKQPKLAGQLLHASKLAFTHPTSKEKVCFSSPLPSYFLDFLDKLIK